jgi:hypothetical protein
MLNIKWVISMNNLVYLPLLLPRDIGKNQISLLEKDPIILRKEDLINLMKKYLKNLGGRILNLLKENALIVVKKKWHYADFPNTPGKLKNKINSLKIDEEERNDLFGIL